MAVKFKLKKKINLVLGDCISVMEKIPDKSINLIFADPPYNLSGDNYISMSKGKAVICNKGNWDKFLNINQYIRFSFNWIKECKRVLNDSGTIWITGTFHCHPIIGFILKILKFWIINDIVWYKPNAPELLFKNRFTPSTELIWLASKSKKYYFNYSLSKNLNNGNELRNLWVLKSPKHKTSHPTEKPEKLIKFIILIGSRQNDIILDPFMGSGTTGVIAKQYNRYFIGIEKKRNYLEIAKKRILLNLF